jgi:tetratricopeptide (TPR) repeat protein
MPLPNFNLGLALSTKGDQEAAIRAFRTGLQLAPKDAKAHCSLGEALSRNGDQEEAIRAFQAALEINPKYAEAHHSLGVALGRKGDHEGAIRAFQAAVQMNPRSATSYTSLGKALQKHGRFTEALSAFRTGHQLGSQQPNWRYPSADWVRRAEQLVELDARLAKTVKGERQPADAGERAQLAWLCLQPYHLLTARAARLYTEAFATDPRLADDWSAQHRYNAACAAALAGSGKGKDATTLDEAERGRLRRQALTWLRAELTARHRQLESDKAKAGPVVQQTLQQWLRDTDLAGVRCPDALARLPEAERRRWQTLWAEVEQLFTDAGGQGLRPQK